MTRTRSRPVPSGRVSPRAALTFGVALQVASFLLLSLTVNVLAASLALSGFLGYVFVYTLWLKRSTPQNIVIGGAAGRGAAAGRVGGDDRLAVVERRVPVRDRLLLDAAALLGAVAADEGRVREGRRADDAGGARRGRDARKQIVLYTGLLFLVTQLPVCGGLLGAFYMVVAAVLSAVFGVGALALQRSRERRQALRLYLFSLAYLALLFGAMVIDARLFTPIV